MKKRILSLFLVLCMLAALLPVTSATAETAEAATPAEKTAYDAFYVQDGLVGLYTAYATDDGGDASLTVEGGAVTAWADKVSGKTATVFGGFTANRSGKGGFGIAIDIDDFSSSALNSGITFSEEYVALSDYTVETVLSYDNLIQNGAAVTTQKYQTGYSAFRVGLYASTWFNGTSISHRVYLSNRAWGQHNGRTTENAVHVVTGVWCDPSGTISASAGAYVGNGFGMTPATVYTQSFTKATNGATVSLEMTLNGNTQRLTNTYYGSNGTDGAFTAYTTGSLSLSSYAALYNTSSTNAASRFSLLNGIPGDVYAVRIYNRPLTLAEKAQNRFVDLAAYFELDVSGLLSSAPLPATLTDAFAAYTFENGNAATLQAIIDQNKAGTEKSYLDLYVLDGLVALFDAFSTTNISLSKSQWYALAPNAAGTLYQKKAVYGTLVGGRYSASSNLNGWRTYSEGGLGYSDPENAADNAITFPTSLMSDTFEIETVMKNELRNFPTPRQTITSFVTETLTDGIAYTATGSTSWSADCTATVTFTNTSAQTIRFVPVFYRRASTSDTAPNTEFFRTTITLTAGETITVSVGGYLYNQLKITVPDGIKVTTVRLPQASSTAEARADSAFTYGNLYAMVWTNRQSSNTYGNGFGLTRWYVANSEWKNHNGGKTNTAFHSATASDTSDFLRTDGEIYQLNVTRTTDSAGIATFTYTHGQNKYSLSSVADKTLSDAALTLANDLPSTLYSVRVYNRLLTEAERNRNHAADLFGYTGLDISLYLAFPATQRALLDTALAEIDLSTDKAATAQKVNGAISLLLYGDTEAFLSEAIAFDTVEPLESTPGYRTIFRANNGSVKTLTQNGYTIYYGALVTVGEDASGAGVALSGGSLVATGGATLVHVYGGGNATGRFLSVTADQNTYSVAVKYDKSNAYDLETSVRGFIAAVSPKGELTVAYADAPMPNDAHRMDLLADYFVNVYQDSAMTAAAYMQNAALRSVLSASGISARKEINTDSILTIFVDPNGDDNALGTEVAPYATLSKAYIRALEAYSAGVRGVIIRLSKGVHRVSEEFYMDGTWLGEDCELALIGEGRDTVLTSTTPIGTAQNGVITLPESLKGTSFRYLYAVGADGALTPVDMTYTGGPDDFRIFNYAQVQDDTAKTVYVLMDASFFKGSKSYAGTEVHITTEWDFNILHIDHVDYSATQPSGTAVPSGYVMVYLNYYEFINIAIPTNHTFSGKEYWIENSADVFADGNNTTDVFYYDQAAGKIHIANHASDSTLNATTSYEIATLERIFTLKEMQNVAFLNFTLTGVDSRTLKNGTSYAGGQAGTCTVINSADGTKLFSGFPETAAIYADDIKNFVADNMFVTCVAGDGIQLRGAVEDVTIQNSEFSHLGQTSVRIGTNGAWQPGFHNLRVEILNNYIHHTGELFVQNCGLLVTSAMDSRIMGNTVTNTTYTAISLGWRWSECDWTLDQLGGENTTHLFRVEVAYNYIADFMTCMRDGGGIYILGGNAENEEHTLFNFMHDNYMVITEETGKHNETKKRWFMGYYHDGASSNWYDANNVIINATTTGVGNLVPLYVQHISGQLAHNITLKGNYAIGFTGAQQVYAGHIVADRYIYADDYLFTGVSAMSAAQKTAAANIHASAGSTLAPVGTTGGLGVSGTKSEPTMNYGGTHNNTVLSALSGFHSHTFGVWTAVDGETHVHACSCGATRTEAHSFDTTVTKQPTYTEEGACRYTCGGCGHSYTATLPALTLPEEIFSLSAQNATAASGGTVKVTFTLSHNPGVGHIVFDLVYDTSVLTLVRVDAATEDFTLTTDGNRVSLDATTLSIAEGVLCTAVFRVDKEAPLGATQVSPVLVSCTDQQEENVLLQTLSASVSVVAVLYGDANGDGEINGADVIALRTYLLTAEEDGKAGSDVNGDGTVDGRDLILLRKFLVGTGELGPA